MKFESGRYVGNDVNVYYSALILLIATFGIFFADERLFYISGMRSRFVRFIRFSPLFLAICSTFYSIAMCFLNDKAISLYLIMFIFFDGILLLDWYFFKKCEIKNHSFYENKSRDKSQKILGIVFLLECMMFYLLMISSSSKITLLPIITLALIDSVTYSDFYNQIMAYDLNLQKNLELFYIFFFGLICYTISVLGFLLEMMRSRVFILSALCFSLAILGAFFIIEANLSEHLFLLLALGLLLFLHGCLSREGNVRENAVG
jgi:hypothetical protein